MTISDLDLTQMSAAELLQGLEEGTIVFEGDEEPEKTAGDDPLEDIDLNDLSGRELLELYSALEEQEAEKTAAAALDKLAKSGELAQLDMSGRVMAHAFMDEIDKVASEDDDLPDEISLDDISGEDLVALLESGEYELEEGSEKTAGRVGKAALRIEQALGRAAEKSKGPAGKAYRGAKKGLGKAYRGAKKGGRGYWKALKGEQLAKGLRKHRLGRQSVGRYTEGLKAQGYEDILRGGAKTVGAYGVPLAGAGGGAVALKRKKK